MLMENRVDGSDGAQNAKKPRSVDLQTLYDQNPKLPIVDAKHRQASSLKRKHGDVDSGLEKKKSKKELLLSRLQSGKKVKKSLDEVYKGGSSSTSSDLNKVESEPSQTDDRANGFDGYSLNLGNDIRQIPKRKRDLVRRKKAVVINGLKQEGNLGGKVSSGDVAADLSGTLKGNTGQDDEKKGNLDQNGNFNDGFGACVDKKAKQRKDFNGHKDSSSSKIDLLRLLEKDTVVSHDTNGDPSSNKKAKRSRKTRKETGVVTDAKPVSDQFTRTRNNSLEDEENLEENAARMLSSRFDPNCTGFSSNSKCSDSPVVVPLGRNDANFGSDLQAKSDVASGDTEVRVLRPRDQCKRKGHARKRRHFYEVSAKDVDAVWMVEKKIKVYWPLDQIWYFGEVIGFDPKKLLHHIKYDDREEEWIDLHNERIKLLLFPSELPFKAGRRRSRAGGRHHAKEESNAMLQDDYPISKNMDSEPIISWLAKSTGRIKSSSLGTSKKPKTSNQSEKSRPSSSTLPKGTASECINSVSSKNDADEPLSNPVLPDVTCGGEVGTTSQMMKSRKYPIVYFRRRFRRKVGGRGDVPVDKLGRSTDKQIVCNQVGSSAQLAKIPTTIFDSSAVQLVNLELPRFVDDLVILNLDTLMINTEVYGFKLNFLPFLVPYYSFGVENLRVFHALLMLQHGTLMTLWPRVYLEMLFVDNLAGLRFVLFEGSLLQALAFVFCVLKVFHQSNQQRKHINVELPVTSVRFQFSFLEDALKQLVFAFYNFCQLETSSWVFIDQMVQKSCFIAKQLPSGECTYHNIKALGLRRRTRQPMTGVSACVKHRHSWVNMDGKCAARLPPFALSFSAAPTFFRSLHLKLLMECSNPCAKFNDGNSVSLPENGGIEQVDCSPDDCRTNLGDMSRNGLSFDPPSCSNDDVGKTVAPAACESQVSDDGCLNKGQGNKLKSERRDSLLQTSCPKDNYHPHQGKTTYRPLNGITVEIPLFDPQERPTNSGVHSVQSSMSALKATDSSKRSRSSTVSRSSCHPSKVGSSLLGKPDLLSSGPKKPRTQVSYSLPPEGHDITTKSKTRHIKGFSHKRIRTACEKRETDASRKYQRNMDALSCDVNLLVYTEDRGWREEGARVVLEPVDDNEWQLVVKISECIRFAYKANQFLQSGSTNRYTHAMMWKGGKDWSLEFPDRSQWTLFKEMHEECYSRNFRAALVKNIPIPGVRLIEENDDDEVELPFIRPSSRYLRQLQTDVDIAMDPSCVLYDMDSDDELWISKIRSSGAETCGLRNFSDEMFEMLMDKLEKMAYAEQQDRFTSDELEQLGAEGGGGSLEAIKIIYEHWLEKRQKKGMPLIRHLQPPLWERYHKQVKEWEVAMAKNTRSGSSGWNENTMEKPPVFAFCLKPRGLELHHNRVTKQRSHKKLSVAGHGNVILGDPEAFHPYGRRLYSYTSGEDSVLYHHGSLDSPQMHRGSTRLFSPRNVGSPRYLPLNGDGYERIQYPRLYRTKSRKIGSLLESNDQQAAFRFPGKRNGRQVWNNNYLPGSPSPRYGKPERFSIEHLDPADLDEFRLRDAASAAQHAVNMARMKREHAQRLLYKADLAIHKAAVAMMAADAIKASREGEASTDDVSSDE